MLLEKFDSFNDIRFLVDQLVNSMEFYDEEEFVNHISSETKYDKEYLRKVFNAYWDMNPQTRSDAELYDIDWWEEWLESIDKPECYIDYLDSKKNFRQSRKDFSSYEEAKKWMMKTMDKWDIDMIKYY